MTGRSAPNVRGLFTALITPFDSKGRVDEGQLARLVKFQVSKGVDGIYPCGSTGLGPMLNTDERKQVAETVIDAAGGKVPVVVQVGSADTASTVKLAKHAEAHGAYAVASLTPYYYKPGESATIKHFQALSEAVDVPVFAYNIPHLTGNNLTPSAVAELSKVGVSGIKESSRDFLQLLDLISAAPDGFVVMNGVEEYGLFALLSGADGLVSGGASAFPEIMENLVSAGEKADRAAALSAQKRAQQAKALVRSSPIPYYYAILKARGIDCGDPRPPFQPVGKADAAKAHSALRRLGMG
ncbi:MAG: dihydrodipicolinate synthase family protein [Nitrososphaerota archaeon]|nr:dihydrodipicolinate synthase family protein [Nitrososphaerota archaeon]